MNLSRVWGLILLIVSGVLAWMIAFDPVGSSGSKSVGGKFRQGAAESSVVTKKVLDESAALESDDDFETRPKTPGELAAEISAHCKLLSHELKLSNFENQFSKVTYRIHEERLKELNFKSQLKDCFHIGSGSPARMELDIFSADFAGENAAGLIQIQISIFDTKTSNKIFESGFHFDLNTRVN